MPPPVRHARLKRMSSFGLKAGNYYFVILALASSAASGQTSDIDLSWTIDGYYTAAGLSVASANGFLYTVGVSNSPATFPNTPGALNAPRTSAMVFAQKRNANGAVVTSAPIADASLDVFNPAANASTSNGLYLIRTACLN